MNAATKFIYALWAPAYEPSPSCIRVSLPVVIMTILIDFALPLTQRCATEVFATTDRTKRASIDRYRVMHILMLYVLVVAVAAPHLYLY